MAGKNIKEEPQRLNGYTKVFLKAHPEIDPKAYLALQHEVTQQFPAEPTATPHKVEPEPVQQLPEGVDAEAFLALHHEEVTEQFPAEPAAPSKKVEPRKVQQLPPGVKAEDYLALRGEQPA